MGELGVKRIELSLTFYGKKKVQDLNRDFRKKDVPTDVLAFALHDPLCVYEVGGKFHHPFLNLGDIIICKEVAKKQAKDINVPLKEEILRLYIHGLLHLCGYDQEVSTKEEKIMFKMHAFKKFLH